MASFLLRSPMYRIIGEGLYLDHRLAAVVSHRDFFPFDEYPHDSPFSVSDGVDSLRIFEGDGIFFAPFVCYEVSFQFFPFFRCSVSDFYGLEVFPRVLFHECP